jgi:hypothetical protein
MARKADGWPDVWNLTRPDMFNGSDGSMVCFTSRTCARSRARSPEQPLLHSTHFPACVLCKSPNHQITGLLVTKVITDHPSASWISFLMLAGWGAGRWRTERLSSHQGFGGGRAVVAGKSDLLDFPYATCRLMPVSSSSCSCAAQALFVGCP